MDAVGHVAGCEKKRQLDLSLRGIPQQNPLALGTTQPSLFLFFSVYLARIGDFETDATPSEHADFLPNPRSQLGVSPVPDDR